MCKGHAEVWGNNSFEEGARRSGREEVEAEIDI